MPIDVTTIAMIELKGLIRLQAVDCIAQIVKVPERLAYRGLWVCFQEGADGLGHNSHRVERRRPAMLVEPLRRGTDKDILAVRGQVLPSTISNVTLTVNVDCLRIAGNRADTARLVAHDRTDLGNRSRRRRARARSC